MAIKNCSKCDVQPLIQSDELGMGYRFICGTCGKCTQDILSPSSTLVNPHADEETIARLTAEWNGLNN